MAFEVCQLSHRGGGAVLPEGAAGLTKAGILALRVVTLREVNITTHLVVLADADTRRIALRRPRDGEDALARELRLVTASGKPARVARFSIRTALERLGWKRKAGRYATSRKDDLLIFGPV
ncbi:MAG TPA: hypothetical protein PKC49_03485 [Phycisphaerae bacterium]|nr:hypothetical protein [Phycisphaerae bacterium]